MPIPVLIHLDVVTFKQLEKIAQRKDTTMRELIAEHLRRSLEPVRPVTSHRPRRAGSDDIEQWCRLARQGVSNNAIAEQFGVSKSLVSIRLRERGIRRQRRRSAT